MISTRKWVFPVLGLLIIVFAGSCVAPPALAGDNATMKCAANQDRVWVYDSLGSFDVSAKLKCGETVEIISRVKGFVKIHSASGVEGYVPDSTFPNLPPLEDDSNKTPASAASLAQAAARARAHTAVAAASPAPASIAPSPAAAVVPVATNVAAPPTPAVTPAHAPVAMASTSSAAAQPPAAAPVEIVLSTSAEMPPAVNATSATSAPVASAAVASAQPVSSSSAASSPVKMTSATTGSSTGQPGGTNSNTRSAPSTVSTGTSATKTSVAVSSAAKSSTKSSASQPPATGSTHSSPAPAPTAPSTVPSNSKALENTASVQPSHPIASLHPVAATVESEDFPDAQPESESADPACQIFFSAYGLTPDQIKWVAQNRKKKFANVCPAADTSRVDFVVIFTHDIDFYGNTLPNPVHTDKNGFSDFSPMSMLDTTVTPLSVAEKARHEYVYVFKMKRGAFDPARFSPRRRYQFTKAESNSLASSHASSRTVEDAFHFMEQQGPSN